MPKPVPRRPLTFAPIRPTFVGTIVGRKRQWDVQSKGSRPCKSSDFPRSQACTTMARASASAFHRQLRDRGCCGTCWTGRRGRWAWGAYPDFSLAEARVAASEARKLKALGRDPIDSREAYGCAGAGRGCPISHIPALRQGLHSGSRRWLEKRENQGPMGGRARSLCNAVHRRFARSAVDVALVHKVLEPIWSSKTETASRVRGRIESDSGLGQGPWISPGDNPARWKGHLENLFPARSKVQKVEHHAALPYAKMGAFMATLKAQEGNGALALQFTILTAARTGELIGARWRRNRSGRGRMDNSRHAHEGGARTPCSVIQGRAGNTTRTPEIRREERFCVSGWKAG